MTLRKPYDRAVAGPTRTCVVCRQARPAHELLRLRERDGVACIEGPMARRGAWVCIARDCLRRLDGRVLSRALKRPVAVATGSDLRAAAARVAEQRVYALLGLARRQGALRVGQDSTHGEPVGCAVVAADASERSTRRAGPSAWVFGTRATLSRSTGLREAAVLGIAPGSLARQAAYWLAVWYESRPASEGSERE
jgi:predicted RNA-binding protein YlxR (DUF448 family)